MYSPRLYKYRDSYELYIPTTHAFGSLLLIHTLLVTDMTFPPPDSGSIPYYCKRQKERVKSLGRLCEYISSSLDIVHSSMRKANQQKCENFPKEHTEENY